MKSPAVGIVAWVVLATTAAAKLDPGVGIIEVLLLFGPLVLVPVGLPLALGRDRAARWTAAVSAAAIAGTIAFVITGPPSVALTLPWLGVTLALSSAAVARWRAISSTDRGLSDMVRAVAVLWLPLAAVGITMSRADLTLSGVPNELILLGGVHFDFAGFGATLIAACVLSATAPGSRSHAWARFATACTVLGCATVGVGHLTTRPVELVGAHLMAVGVVTLGAISWSLAPRSSAARVLLRLSAVAVLLPMVFALLYSWSLTLGTEHLPYETIAAIHGSLNAFGFTLCGLVAWRVLTADGPLDDQPGLRLASNRRPQRRVEQLGS